MGTVWDDLVTGFWWCSSLHYKTALYIHCGSLRSVSTREFGVHKTDCKHLKLRKTQHERQNREIKCWGRMQGGVY